MKDAPCPAAAAVGSVQRHGRGRAGFTLIEVVFATVITAVVVGGTARAILRLQDCLVDATVRATTLERSIRLLDRLVAELRDAHRDSLILTPATDARSVTFSAVNGWDGSERVTGSPRTIFFESGTVFLDGTPIAALVDELRFNLESSLLTIVVEIKTTTRAFGSPGTVSRKLSAQLTL